LGIRWKEIERMRGFVEQIQREIRNLSDKTGFRSKEIRETAQMKRSDLNWIQLGFPGRAKYWGHREWEERFEKFQHRGELFEMPLVKNWLKINSETWRLRLFGRDALPTGPGWG
jgi:hypothetical protein